MTDASCIDDVAARTRRILDPDFLEGLEDLTVQELRARRKKALADREFQSYLRRLIQVRQDILCAEQDRRAAGLPQPPLVERLAAVLANGPAPGSARGEAIRMALPEVDLVEAGSRAEAATADLDLSQPESIDPERLQEALGRLAEEERRVSSDRTAVFGVLDRLQEELKRRYRDDPSLIPLEV